VEAMFVSHVVYGLRVAANIALPGLPLQPDSDVYDVRIRLKDWARFPETLPASAEVRYTSPLDATRGAPSLQVVLFPGGDYFGFLYGDHVRFAVERLGREVWGDWPKNYSLEDACTYLLGPVIGFVLRLRGVTCLHASAIAVGEQSIALVGPPGAGKSTTAAAFARRGFPVISDDVVALIEEGEDFLVPPAYPRVNLWSDSARALFGPETLPRITPTWDKRYLALGENGFAFASKPLPLAAIYFLCPRDRSLTAPVVEAVAGREAFVRLIANTYVNYLLDRSMRSREFDLLSRVLAGVPTRTVRPQGEPLAIFDLCETIATDARQVMIPKSSAASRRD
jgi:hypothetical protein